MPLAVDWHLAEITRVEGELETYLENLERLDSERTEGDEQSAERAVTIKNILFASSNLERLDNSEMIEILAAGHFLAMFTAFDAFTGELLTALYEKKPELYRQINSSMTVVEMLEYEHVDDIKGIILQNEIEAFRRKSYVEQFQILETRFKIPLNKFKHWPFFVECTQRRNLFTHCDGIISEQYLKMCKQEGVNLPDDIKVGNKFKLTSQYLISVCAVMIEVGFKLGQTLWRKLIEEEIEEAGNHLHSVQYDFLENEEWHCACMAGEFATSLPHHSSEVHETIVLVNYAISLKALDKKERLESVLEKRDWTALCYDFRLAERILQDDYETASELMKKIGKSGEFVNEQAYHSWPLFRDFRQSDEFQNSYLDIYGYDFTTKLKEGAEEVKKEALEEIEREENALAATSVDEAYENDLLKSGKGECLAPPHHLP